MKKVKTEMDDELCSEYDLKGLEAFLKLEFRSLTRLIGSDTGGI